MELVLHTDPACIQQCIFDLENIVDQLSQSKRHGYLLSNAFVGTYFRTVLFYAYLLILWLTTLTDAGRALEGLKQILFDLCNVFYSNQCNIRY